MPPDSSDQQETSMSVANEFSAPEICCRITRIPLFMVWIQLWGDLSEKVVAERRQSHAGILELNLHPLAFISATSSDMIDMGQNTRLKISH